MSAARLPPPCVVLHGPLSPIAGCLCLQCLHPSLWVSKDTCNAADRCSTPLLGDDMLWASQEHHTQHGSLYQPHLDKVLSSAALPLLLCLFPFIFHLQL